LICRTAWSRGSLETARAILSKAGGKLLLPVDAVVADRFEAEANGRVVDVDKVPAGWRAGHWS
jgi:phosphoglycerate kinase